MEGRAGSLEDQQSLDAGTDSNSGTAFGGGLNIACFGAVTEEGVRVREAVNDHASPTVSDGFDVGSVDMRVLFDKVRGDNGGEELGRGDGVLFGKD